MKVIKYKNTKDFFEEIKRPVFDQTKLENTVKSILEEVKNNGDNALRKFTKEFDEVEINDFLVSENELKKSEKKLGHSDKEAENIAWATANKRGMLDNKNKKK